MDIQILNEIKDILTQEKCKDSECVSLYDVLTIVSGKRRSYDRAEHKFENYLEVGMDDYYSFRLNPYSTKIFDYERMELKVGYNFDYVTFIKINGDLIIKKSDTYKARDLLYKCGEKISNYYDSCLEYKSLFTQQCDNIESVNSKFLVDINSDEVSISSSIQDNRHIHKFELSANTKKSEYSYTCESNNVISAFRNKEDEILKRIFIRIEDCPKWTQFSLYEIRKQQLEQELKYEKRLELKRKLFPFLNKTRT